MTMAGLLFRLEAGWGNEDGVSRFLEDELPALLEDLPATTWYAVRFDQSRFGVVAVFPYETGEESHVGDRIAAALRQHGADLFASMPAVEGFDVLAPKVPAAAP
jgi:hypothetical protein